MAVRDKLLAGAQRFLEPGETVRQIVLAQGGSPWVNTTVGLGPAIAIAAGFGAHLGFLGAVLIGAFLGGVGGLVAGLFHKARSVVVTDRSVLLIQLGKWTTKSESLIVRLPRDTRLGPLRKGGAFGDWAKMDVYSESLWVHRRFHGDVAAADAALPQGRPDL